jgi:hypothetical protein
MTFRFVETAIRHHKPGPMQEYINASDTEQANRSSAARHERFITQSLSALILNVRWSEVR